MYYEMMIVGWTHVGLTLFYVFQVLIHPLGKGEGQHIFSSLTSFFNKVFILTM